MIISSWNVNSVRARIENIKEYLNKFSPDILMMQEIKTPDETYPYDDIKTLKYENYVFGQKSYNGVAIISKKKLDSIKNDIFKDKNKQSRIISAEVKHKKKTIRMKPKKHIPLFCVHFSSIFNDFLSICGEIRNS